MSSDEELRQKGDGDHDVEKRSDAQTPGEQNGSGVRYEVEAGKSKRDASSSIMVTASADDKGGGIIGAATVDEKTTAPSEKEDIIRGGGDTAETDGEQLASNRLEGNDHHDRGDSSSVDGAPVNTDTSNVSETEQRTQHKKERAIEAGSLTAGKGIGVDTIEAQKDEEKLAAPAAEEKDIIRDGDDGITEGGEQSASNRLTTESDGRGDSPGDGVCVAAGIDDGNRGAQETPKEEEIRPMVEDGRHADGEGVDKEVKTAAGKGIGVDTIEAQERGEKPAAPTGEEKDIIRDGDDGTAEGGEQPASDRLKAESDGRGKSPVDDVCAAAGIDDGNSGAQETQKKEEISLMVEDCRHADGEGVDKEVKTAAGKGIGVDTIETQERGEKPAAPTGEEKDIIRDGDDGTTEGGEQSASDKLTTESDGRGDSPGDGVCVAAGIDDGNRGAQETPKEEEIRPMVEDGRHADGEGVDKEVKTAAGKGIGVDTIEAQERGEKPAAPTGEEKDIIRDGDDGTAEGGEQPASDRLKAESDGRGKSPIDDVCTAAGIDDGNSGAQETQKKEEISLMVEDCRHADGEGVDKEVKTETPAEIFPAQENTSKQQQEDDDIAVKQVVDQAAAGDDSKDNPQKKLANVDVAAVGGTDEIASARGSHESSVSEEENLDDDPNGDLDKPWVPPSFEHAIQARKRLIWNQGMRSYLGTTIEEIGAMGVGLYVYFWMVRIVAMAFLFCALLSLPSLILNAEGNAGMDISEADMDSLRLVSLSYGNQGVNPSLVVESECISSDGTVDCTEQTVQVFGLAKDAVEVGNILVRMEILIALFFIALVIILSEKLEAKIEEIDRNNVTPADYTVTVRGLPRDVTKEEVRQHFHARYSLTAPGPFYPFLGVSTTGVAVFWAATLGVVVGALLTPAVVAWSGLKAGGAAASAAGLACFLTIVVAVFAVSKACGVGRPRKRDSPAEEWEKERKQLQRREARAKKKDLHTAPVVVVPVEDALSATEGQQKRAADAAGMLEAEGVSAAGLGGEEEDRPPDPVPCQSCLNTQDKSFLGSWVADVVLGNPVGDVLQGFLDQEESFAQIQKARVVVRQMKTLGKAKRLAKAEARLAKLKTKEEALMAATRKKQDPAKLEVISVAFVTFEHEESKRRCLEDYRYSRSAFGRHFQPTTLRFCRPPEPVNVEGGVSEQSPIGKTNAREKPRGQMWRLKVFQAPEPSDVKWENLDVTPRSRKLRRALTSLVCAVLLIVSFSIIYLMQNEQTKLAQRIPTLDTCAETLPAVIFGTYDFPTNVELGREEALDSTCPEGSFYLVYTTNSSSLGALNYTSLPNVFSADGTSVTRAEFELEDDVSLCDDPCSPTSGGSTCSALSCYETSWGSEGFNCVTYPESTAVGCFCLDAVVTSLRENGLIAGARVVTREQGAVCVPFLADYAQANALNILAVLTVVVVNSLLTSVMGKLAKFERHVSLSDYTSTFTAKLALGQFLNTALVVIIVNAGYTGGGLGFLQDMGMLSGDYTDFERGWYATVGVAVAMTMLLNVVVPHVEPLVGELVVTPIMRFFMKRSAATQADLDDLYKPPTFSMESRYAFLLQVLGVSMLYSGGIPILYVFTAFIFATNFVVDKLWIIKLTQQPPMYTASLAQMFVGIMPIAILLHMALTVYMLGNSDILNIGFVSDEAEAFAAELQGKGFWGLVADHALRKHTFPLFVLTNLFLGLYVAYKIVGNPLLTLLKLILRSIFQFLFGWLCQRKPTGKAYVIAEQPKMPGFTAEYFRVLKKDENIEADEKAMGWVVSEGDKTARWLFTEDGPGPRGVRGKKGFPRRTWQAIAELGQYNYVMEESDTCGLAARYMATAGFSSPRMKEKAKLRKAKTERAALKEAEGARAAPEAENGNGAGGADPTTTAVSAAAAATSHSPLATMLPQHQESKRQIS